LREQCLHLVDVLALEGLASNGERAIPTRPSNGSSVSYALAVHFERDHEAALAEVGPKRLRYLQDGVPVVAAP
jgi:hypothetical protein